MSGLALRARRSGRPSGTKRKRDANAEEPAPPQTLEESADDGDGEYAEVEDEGAGVDNVDDEDAEDEEETEEEGPPPSTRRKGKRGRGRYEEDDDHSDSSPSGKGDVLKVERHAKVVNRAKRKLREEKKKRRAKHAKGNLTLEKGVNFDEGRERAGRRVARAMNKSVLDLEESYPRRTAEEFKSRIPKPQYDEYWLKEQQLELVARMSADGDF
ncbi:hypothetical protein DHEL01_v213117 [Diaporthe helianthi]|uniref:Uncharacterized protein n=1 Tax=Diaporthe helianthi TaxID=158607 RepID=A0A2P5HE32_DIAHE|nr:hypothetical protein DHEL01_v213117 [Diaporthe helianthi]